MFKLLLFVILSYAIQCSELSNGTLYSVDEAFECIDSVNITEEAATAILTDVKEMFNAYVYKDILKNELDSSDYYQFTVDIDKRLQQISTEEQNVYSYFKSIHDIIRDTRDLHLGFRMESGRNHSYFFDSFYIVLPFEFVVESNDEHKVKMIKSESSAHYGYEVPKEVINNNGKIIKSINGKEPLDFIREYSNTLVLMKSPHGTYTYGLESHDLFKLTSFPITREQIPIFNITFEDDINIQVEYKMYYIEPAGLNEYQKKRLLPKIQGKDLSPIKHSDFFAEDNSAYNYTYESEDNNVACGIYKTSEGKQMNVFVLKSFIFSASDLLDRNTSFLKTMSKCFELIDNNDYPITIILPMNGGGIGNVEGTIEKFFAPWSDVNMYGSVRISEQSERVCKLSYARILSNTSDCVAYRDYDLNTSIIDILPPLGPWYDEPITDIYGSGDNTVEHVRSQLSVMPINEVGSYTKMKNHPRKPTDIVVFTDSFCYSCCSLLTKGFLEKGSAILVGFEGDPEGDIKDFDSGMSPTAVIQNVNILDKYALDLSNRGCSMSISFFETYPYNYKEPGKIPREFIKSPVMERVNIYKFNAETLPLFIEQGYQFYEKYQTQCDPNNDALVMQDDACEGKIDMEHAHGGHPCGKDGKWDLTKCVASYCDAGYKFDKYNQECVIDVCYNETTSSSQPVESSSTQPIEPSSSQPIEPSSSQPIEPSSSQSVQSSSYPEESSQSIPEEKSSSEVIQTSSSKLEHSSSQLIQTSSDDEIDKWIWVVVGVSGGLIVLILVIGIGAFFIIKIRKNKSSYSLLED